MFNLTGLGSNSNVFGLDIGFETLKLCELNKSRSSAKIVGMTDFVITERILEKDRIKNLSVTANMIKEARRSAKPHPIKATNIITALPETFVFSKTIGLPRMSPKELNTAVPNEAAQYLPIPLGDVYLDYQLLSDHPDEPVMDILVAAAPKKLVNDYVEMAKMADLELVALETKPIATGRAIIPEKSKIGILIIHLGTEITRISIWDKGNIKLVTTVPVGKNQLLNQAQSGDPSIKDIKKVKITAAKDSTPLDSVLNSVVDEVIESIRYYQNRTYKPSKIEQIYLSGSGAEASGLVQYINQKIKIKTDIAQPLLLKKEKISPEFITAFGLALRDI